MSDGDDRVVRIATCFRVGSGVVAPGVRLARVDTRERVREDNLRAGVVRLALVQNRHTDAILAPALYTNLSGAPCVCVCLRLRVSTVVTQSLVCVCLCT